MPVPFSNSFLLFVLSPSEIREDRMSRYRIQIADQKAQIDAFQTTLDEKAADRLSLVCWPAV